MSQHEVQKLRTACTMDCPDTCSLEVDVADGRIAAIRGTHENPVTAGFICSKVAQFGRRVHGPERILYPMKRKGTKGAGEFERMTWDEAVRMICDRYTQIKAQFGGEAILPYSYGGSNGLLGQDTMDKAFFSKLGASRLLRSVCAAPTSAAATGMYGKMGGVAFPDYVHAKLILVWGGNPKASNIHLVPYLKQAKAAGAKIVSVDPVLHFSEKECDLHLPVYPGSDLAVALAMINYWNQNNLLDRAFIDKNTVGVDTILEKAAGYTLDDAARMAKVPARDIETLARWYAETSPAVIRIGWGLERNRNGGQAAGAVLAMPALMGKFGIRGGGYTLSNSAALRMNEKHLPASEPWNTRQMNMNLLGHDLLEEKNPPVMALFVYNCNPAATVPNQNAVLRGLSREDLFTVVFEQVMTDTAMFADVILPSVTFLEQHEIKKAYGSYALQYVSPVIDPVGESKPNEEVFGMLGRGMGWTDQVFQYSTQDYLSFVAGSLDGLGKPVVLDELREKRVLSFDFPGDAPIHFETMFPRTQDGKVHFAPRSLGPNQYDYIEEEKTKYPLALISPSNGKMISSTMGEYNYPELFVTMHPQDAAARNLAKGSKVKVFNDLGEVHCRLRIDSRIRQGVAAIPKGAWRKSSLNGQTSTALSPDTCGTAGGACFNDARVEVTSLA